MIRLKTGVERKKIDFFNLGVCGGPARRFKDVTKD